MTNTIKMSHNLKSTPRINVWNLPPPLFPTIKKTFSFTIPFAIPLCLTVYAVYVLQPQPPGAKADTPEPWSMECPALCQFYS